MIKSLYSWYFFQTRKTFFSQNYKNIFIFYYYCDTHRLLDPNQIHYPYLFEPFKKLDYLMISQKIKLLINL